MRSGRLAALRTIKRFSSRVLGQILDTRLTVVVIAGEQLGLLVVAVAYGTRYFLLQFFQRLVDSVWSFSHAQIEGDTRRFPVVYCARALRVRENEFPWQRISQSQLQDRIPAAIVLALTTAKSARIVE